MEGFTGFKNAKFKGFSLEAFERLNQHIKTHNKTPIKDQMLQM